jgi:hypothetical protein
MCITWSLAALDAATTAVATSHATTEPVITRRPGRQLCPFQKPSCITLHHSSPFYQKENINSFKLLKGQRFNFLRGIFLATMAAHRSGDAGLVEVSMLQRPRRNRKVLNQQSEHVFLQNGHATTTSILLAWAATRWCLCVHFGQCRMNSSKAVTKLRLHPHRCPTTITG